VLWSLIVTYLTRRARGSAVAAMLFHVSANFCDFTIWEPQSAVLALLPWVLAAAFTVWALRNDSKTPARRAQ
jgi:membrane protease YdiL (CAAX protease family)